MRENRQENRQARGSRPIIAAVALSALLAVSACSDTIGQPSPTVPGGREVTIGNTDLGADGNDPRWPIAVGALALLAAVAL